MSDNKSKCPPCEEEFNSKEKQQQEHSMMCSKCGLKAKTVDDKAQHNCATC